MAREYQCHVCGTIDARLQPNERRVAHVDKFELRDTNPRLQAAEAANAVLQKEGGQGAPAPKKSKLGLPPKKFMEGCGLRHLPFKLTGLLSAKSLNVTLKGVEGGSKDIEMKPKKFVSPFLRESLDTE
jgi:hypothetical protein